MTGHDQEVTVLWKNPHLTYRSDTCLFPPTGSMRISSAKAVPKAGTSTCPTAKELRSSPPLMPWKALTTQSPAKRFSMKRKGPERQKSGKSLTRPWGDSRPSPSTEKPPGRTEYWSKPTTMFPAMTRTVSLTVSRDSIRRLRASAGMWMMFLELLRLVIKYLILMMCIRSRFFNQ